MEKSILLICGVLALGCASTMAKEKERPLNERGWIGGEFRMVTAFPASFTNAPKAAILVRALNTNTPSGLAGIQEGDLILEANHQPTKKLSRFLSIIDQTKPGTLLPIKFWRDGQTIETSVRAGRETYNETGMFMIGLPGFFYAPKLWPFTVGSAGFSVVAAGFKPEQVSERKELSSAEERYFKSCDPKGHQAIDRGWKVWLVIMQAEMNKNIRSQEIVPAATGLIQKTSGEQTGI